MLDFKYLKTLCLEDAVKDAELLKEMLSDAGYQVVMDIAENEATFASYLKSVTYDIILADYTLPGYNASEALMLAKDLQPGTPFICISGTIGEDKAVELVKQGATDYVQKDRLGRLVFSVDRALKEAEKEKERVTALDKLRDKEIIEKQNEELRKLNATKDKLFSIIAHDLRSPFNSIMGFSQMLINEVERMDQQKIMRMAQIINEASRMAVDLLMNLIEWSLSQSGKIEYNPGHIKLEDVVREVGMIFSSVAKQKEIVIKSNVPTNLSVHADEALLETILRNLISNAIKFTHAGGEVSISAEEQDNNVVVSVADTGIGISKEKIDKLFRIDKHLSTDGTNQEKGTGLGLILCKEFVDKHGGRIWAKSILSDYGAPGGSTFYFSLPLTNGSRN